MQMTQHNTQRCPVLLHPAAATSPALIEAIQRQTGLLVIVNTKRPTTASIRPAFDTNSGPWGGDAA